MRPAEWTQQFTRCDVSTSVTAGRADFPTTENADRLKPLQPMVPGSLMYYANRCARACCIDLILSPALTTKSVQKLVLSHLRSTTNQVRLLS